MYFWPEFSDLVTRVGYGTITYRELTAIIEELGQRHGKAKVESAAYYCTTFEGQMTSNPKPLAEVTLRAEVRKLAWQLLGPPPGYSERPVHEIFGAPATEPVESQPGPKKSRTRKKEAS
jgi:hypothetical protein